MSTNARTARFMRSLPRTPLAYHIEYLHEMAHWSGVYGSAMDVFEHHLYAIARTTAEVPEYRIPRDHPMPERYDTTLLAPQWEMLSHEGEALSTRITRVFRDASDRLQKITEPKTPEHAEARAERRYKRMIEDERRKASAHLWREASRVRRELSEEIHIRVPHIKTKTGA